MFKPQAAPDAGEGTAHGSDKGTRRSKDVKKPDLSSAQSKALDDIETSTTALRKARVLLAEMVSDAVGSGSPSLRSQLNKCSVKVAGVELSVTPGEDTLSVPAGGTQTFTVSGGKGLIVAKVDGKNVKLVTKPKKVKPGQLGRFTLKLPAELKAALAKLPASKSIAVDGGYHSCSRSTTSSSVGMRGG